jgi:L-glutamine-phosphate cytidylyltransferase
VKGIVLAAGRGSRLGELTSDRPKALIEIGGRTLLDRQVTALRHAGAREVAVVAGWQATVFAGLGLPVFVNPDWASTSMVRSLECASAWMERETCLVSYGDIVFHPEDARGLAASAADLCIAYDPQWLPMWRARFADPLDDAETFRADSHGLLLGIGQRPATLDEVHGQYLGLLMFTPAGWAEAAKVIAASAPVHLTDLLNHVARAGQCPVRTFPVTHPWWEFDRPSDLPLGAEVVSRLDAEVVSQLRSAREGDDEDHQSRG